MPRKNQNPNVSFRSRFDRERNPIEKCNSKNSSTAQSPSPPGEGLGMRLNLPITLPIYALTHKIVNQLKLYLYMKSITSGHFKASPENIDQACFLLGWRTPKTFHKNLDWLILNKWVAYNSKTSSCRVIGFARLCFKLDIETKSGVIFTPEDFHHFRPFLYAAVIAYYIRRKDWLERQPERKKGRSSTSMPGHGPGSKTDSIRRRRRSFSRMPNRYLAKILQLDHSTISRYKKAASTAGYATSVHQYEDTQLSLKFLYPMQKSYPEEAHLLVAHNNTVQRQLPDIISTTVHLKRKSLHPP